MGWLRTLLGLGRKNADRAVELVGLVEQLARRASNLSEYRKAIVDAAEAGELDFIFAELSAAKREADDYIKNG